MKKRVSMEDVARRIAEETGGFTGGPVERFDKVGRHTLHSLKRNGLRRDSYVLDVGCGTLRIGYLLIRFLDADRYCGIEPQEQYVKAGLKHAVGPWRAKKMRPRFDHGNAFDFSVFGTKFDFVVARSIFSHASPVVIRRAMESFRENSSPVAVMLASYKQIRSEDGDADVVDAEGTGREWSWRRYRPAYLHAMARACGLWADDQGKKFNGQVWLRISRVPLGAAEAEPLRTEPAAPPLMPDVTRRNEAAC